MSIVSRTLKKSDGGGVRMSLEADAIIIASVVLYPGGGFDYETERSIVGIPLALVPAVIAGLQGFLKVPPRGDENAEAASENVVKDDDDDSDSIAKRSPRII